jgi:hypothetical protein
MPIKKSYLFLSFLYFGCSGNTGTAILYQNDCITSTTVVDDSVVAAIATIIAVAAVVVAAVDGSSEGRQFASKCG